MTMRRLTTLCSAGLIALSSSCHSAPTAPERGSVTLNDLRLVAPDLLGHAFEPGQPLLVLGETDVPSVGEQPYLLAAPGFVRAGTFRALLPERRMWDALPALEFSLLVQAWGDLVFIRFKEAEQEHGVDDAGVNVTSPETVERMIDWVRERGLTVTREWATQPGVTATLPPDPDLVREIRGHANVDLLEPAGAPVHPDEGDEPGQIRHGTLVGVISSSELGVVSGDTLEVEYLQPDGTVLMSFAVAR